METLKINFIQYSTERTGGTRTLLNYANELNNLGHEVSFTTLYHDPWFSLNDGVRVITKKTKFSLYYYYSSIVIHNKIGKTSLGAEFSLLKKLVNMAPEADINVSSFPPTAYVASWLSHKALPFYLLMHDPIFFATDKFQKQFYNDTLFLPVNKIVNSIWLQRRIYDRTQIEFPIMNTGAVNPQIFKPASDITREGRKNEIHIVALGKGGFKNSKLIKDAVEIVRRNNLNISVFLHFFGHRLPGNIILDSQTFFHKDLDDVELARLYSKCDIQVTTSTAESFPLPPLEAMACGCSVITTPYGTEDYAIDNVNCLIVRPDDVSDLVSKIELLIFDPSLQKKLKTEGLKTSMRFSYAKQSKDLEAYFKSKMDSDQ